MEKLKITSLYWVLMAFGLLFTTNAFAQGNRNGDENGDDPVQPPSLIVVDEDEGGNGDPVILDSGSEATLCYSILVANLVPLNQAHQDSIYQLSPSFPAMGLSYTVGGNSGVVEFLDFQLVDTINGHPIFESEVCIDLDFTTECNNLPPPNPWLPAAFDVTAYFDVVQMIDGNPLYPIAPYSSANSLFSCEVFDETCGYCNYLRCLLSEVITQISFEIDYTFNCQASNGFGGGGNEGKSNDQNKNKNKNAFNAKDSNVSVFPAPSQQSATLQYHAQETSIGQIQLFDATGKLIRQRSIDVFGGLNTEQINLNNLENGLYYGRLHLNNRLESFKIMKLE